MAGEDPTNREHLEPDDLHAKGFLARLCFFSGGVVMNLLFALVALPLVKDPAACFRPARPRNRRPVKFARRALRPSSTVTAGSRWRNAARKS